MFFFVLSTVATVMSYVESTNPEKPAVRSAEEILKATRNESPLALIVPSKARIPAALENPKSNMLKIDLLCDANEKVRFKKVSQSLVMININLCESLKSNRHIWIKNATNGFNAQIFKTGEKNFRTDFIQMNPGNNKLVIEMVLKDGQKRVQSLEIISGS